MTSQVNPYNIDGTYPVAGQDNDSQGFRDNFTNSRNNFAFVKSEIEDLQNKAVLKSALTNTVINNDLSAVTLNGATLTAYGETFFDNGGLSGSQSIDFSKGNVQRVISGGSLILNFTGWPPAGKMARLLLWVNVTSVSHTVTLPASINLSVVNEIAGIDANRVITYDATGNYLYEFITPGDASTPGTTLFGRELTRVPNKVHGNLTITGNLTTNSGVVDTGYQYANIGASTVTQILSGKSRLISDANVTLATGNVLLPNTAIDGTIVSIHTTSAITSFWANTLQVGTVTKPGVSISMAAGTGVDFFYHLSENAWYKIR